MRPKLTPTAILFSALLALPAAAQDCVGQNLFDTMAPERLAKLRAATDAIPYHDGLFWQADKGEMRITLLGTYHFADPRHDITMAAFGPLCTDTYLPSLPALAADLDISTATTQLTITACLLGMALGQLFVGPISDSTGRRKPLFVALIFFTLASICCAAAKTGNSFIALRFAPEPKPIRN